MVAGAGLAGLRTAEELRARGYAGQITLIGAEMRPPYDRPPLSKKVLTQAGINPSLRADFGALDVDFRPDEAATRLDAEVLLTADGRVKVADFGLARAHAAAAHTRACLLYTSPSPRDRG